MLQKRLIRISCLEATKIINEKAHLIKKKINFCKVNG